MYKQLLQKIDLHVTKVLTRYSKEVACKSGCADCCVMGINVWRVEHENISEFLKLSMGNFQPSAKRDRCLFLNNEDRCSIYLVRPVVCRMWGAPTLFSSGGDVELPNVDDISQRLTSDKGTLTCCHKNFTTKGVLEKIKEEDLINIDLVLTTLAAINYVYCKKYGFDPTERFRLFR